VNSSLASIALAHNPLQLGFRLHPSLGFPGIVDLDSKPRKMSVGNVGAVTADHWNLTGIGRQTKDGCGELVVLEAVRSSRELENIATYCSLRKRLRYQHPQSVAFLVSPLHSW